MEGSIPMSISFTIKGNPISSKNAIRSGVTKQGRNYTYTLKGVKDYRASALKQIDHQLQYTYPYLNFPVTLPVQISFLFYCIDKRKRDLVNLIQCPADLLQQSGIIQNDYLIINLDGSRIMEVDKLNPRTIINITIL